jgi:hypothetical protein
MTCALRSVLSLFILGNLLRGCISPKESAGQGMFRKTISHWHRRWVEHALSRAIRRLKRLEPQTDQITENHGPVTADDLERVFGLNGQLIEIVR